MVSEVAPFVVWFKRDLRWSDHAALKFAAERGRVLALWVYEPEQWAQPDASTQHFTFANECLSELQTWCENNGGELVRLRGAMTDALTYLHAQLGRFALVSSEESGNAWSYARDIAVKRWCEAYEIGWTEFPNNAVVRRLPSRNVWTKRWRERMESDPLSPPSQVRWVDGSALRHGLRVNELAAHEFGLSMPDKPERVRGGRSMAWSNLESFLSERGARYRIEMSSPITAAHSCSRISAHLAWGAISIRECVHAVNARRAEIRSLPRAKVSVGFLESLKSFEARLHWHCHFIQKLEDEPQIEWRNVHRGFDGLRDEAELESELDPDALQRLIAWRDGNTGFPFVDACMRSLAATGWINFRMRAMLMSFASYNLWLHWRHTGLHLAREFTDYEPGIHWSQSQMQSGVTGINTVRIYNVVKQSVDQDPSGEFIRRWVPELSHLNAAAIHTPWKAGVVHDVYPAPIVDLMASMREAKAKIYQRRRDPEVKEIAKQVFEKHGSRSPSRERTYRKKLIADTSSLQTSLFETEN